MCGGEKVNDIVFDINKYDDENEMWEDINSIIRILIKNENVITFCHEDCGIYVLQYSSSDRELGEPMPYWIREEDY